MSVAMPMHLLATLIWVGGMFFAHLVLRPVVAELMEPPARLELMKRIFDRFFPWVWGCVITLLFSGFWMLLVPFQGQAGLHVTLMAVLGSLMALIFLFIYFLPYRRMASALEQRDLPSAASALALIRKLILTNLSLGLAISALALIGRYHPLA
jgi:uncharacterized membrane protein